MSDSQLSNKLKEAENDLQVCKYEKKKLEDTLKQVNDKTNNLQSNADVQNKDSTGSIVYNFLKENSYVFDIGNNKAFQYKHWFSRWNNVTVSNKPSFGKNENIFNFLRKDPDEIFDENFDDNEKEKILYMINYPLYSDHYRDTEKEENKKLIEIKEIKKKNVNEKRYEFIDIYMKRCEKDEDRLQFACYAYLSFLKNYNNNDLSKDENIQINHQLKNFSDDCRNDYNRNMKSFCENIVNKDKIGHIHFIGNCNTDFGTGGKKIRRNRKSKKVKKSRKKRKSRRKSYNRRGRH